MNLDLSGSSSRRQSICWLKQLVRHVGPGFHLDTVPSDYVTAAGGSVFTSAECATLERSLERLFQILGSEQPYEIGVQVTSDLLCRSRGWKPPLHFHDPGFQQSLLRSGTRKQLIAWLRWHDPQGFDSDQTSLYHSSSQLTLDAARSLLRDQIRS